MIETLEGISSLEIKGEENKRILIFCDRLERWDYGIAGFKIKRGFQRGFLYNSMEQVLIIHTNMIKESEADFIKRKDECIKSSSCYFDSKLETVCKAEFNSIKEVLDQLGIIIHWRV